MDKIYKIRIKKHLKERTKKLNERLLEVQKIWADTLYKKVFDDYKAHEAEKGKLSCAFGFGVSKHYVGSNKKIMIVGQEANGHTTDYEKWGLEIWQDWAIDYLNYKVYGEKSRKYDFKKRKMPPFWQFITKLAKEKHYGVCWNNIDKVRRYIRGNGVTETEDYLLELKDNDKNKDRSILHGKIFDGNTKSLLQKEIEIAKPDIVVFAIGPKNPYYHSLSLAFFDGKEVDDYLNEPGVKYPQIKNNKYCLDISESLKLDIPAYYTYHPKYLTIIKKMDKVINIICKK